ncbi:MAG: helix-turn-helix transcriptional regulator [Clostridia bacterium]|nr:helix-turn-helix transcriptional regulator [Clostridia bacterium]
MEKPFRFIEYKITRREEFNVTEGRQPTFALFWLKEGSFRLQIGERETLIGAGDLVVLPDDVDFSRSVIQPISFVYLKFCINPKCPFTLPLPSGKVELADRERFLSNISLYEALTEAEDARSLYLREHALEDILLQISTEYHRVGQGGQTEGDCHDPLVHSALQYIRDHLTQKLTVGELCRALSTNPSTLNFKMRRELSLSVGECVINERMRLARRLLTNTTFSVGEIAVRCGYENIYYFSTVFRQYHGIAPTAYRGTQR